MTENEPARVVDANPQSAIRNPQFAVLSQGMPPGRKVDPALLGLSIHLLLLFSLLLSGCGKAQENVSGDRSSWDETLAAARGTTVRMAMWDGDPLINAYMRDYVKPALESEYGLILDVSGGYLSGGQTIFLVNKLMVDLEAGRETGEIDVVWINGATFYQLRQLKALYGPFTDRLPNGRYIDWEDPFIAQDFQQPIEGYECPWGNVQLTIIYHSERVADPPRTKEALAEWVRSHPGRFTFDISFTGMTFLKSLLYDYAGGSGALDGPFDEQVYEAAAAKLWDYVRDIKPHLWRNGETFPENVAQLHQFFANGEVDFTMSNNDGEVDNKVVQGILPEAARGYVFDTGTIRNTHYLGIPVNAPNKAGALVLANFLISPEAQLKKATPAVWGDGTVLSTKLLPPEWQERFTSIEGRTRVPPRDELEPKALREPVSEIMVRLHDEFRQKILEVGR